MFNTTSNNNSYSNQITFNSVAGTIVKSTPNSKFTRFNMKSDLVNMFFHKETPHRYKPNEYNWVYI